MPKSKDVVSWKDRMSSEAKDVAALERPQSSNISLRGGQMTYMDTPVPDDKLKCVIVASAFENAWFDRPFDPDNIRAPACFSLSSTGDSMVPHEDSEAQQHTTCSGCDFAKWGSAPGNSRGKACKEKRRLQIMPITALEEVSSIATAETAMMTLPVTSVNNWKTYVNQIAAAYSRPPWGVITEIEVKRDPKTQFKVFFNFVGVIEDDDMLGAINAKIPEAVNTLLTPYEPNKEDEEVKDSGKF